MVPSFNTSKHVVPWTTIVDGTAFHLPASILSLAPKDNGGTIMMFGGRQISMGVLMTCYLDVTQYLESCNVDFWKTVHQSCKDGQRSGSSPEKCFQVSHGLKDSIGDLIDNI